MSKTQTDKCRYPSRYSPGQFITEAQYIVELICESQAKAKKKDLPIQFWKLPEWQKFFRSQVRRCKQLQDKYSTKAILNTINNNKGKFNTLFSKFFEDLVASEYRKLNIVKHTDFHQSALVETTSAKPVERHTPKSIIDKLKELE